MYLNAQTNPISETHDWDGPPEDHWLFKAQFTAGLAIHPESDAVGHECKRLSASIAERWEEGEWPDAIEELLWEDRLFLPRLIRGLLQTKPICLAISCPDRLDQLFWEARFSLAVGNPFSAVCSARGCLELAVTDIAHRLGHIPEPDGSVEYSKTYPVRQRFNLISAPRQDVRESAHEIYTRASNVIHTGAIPTEGEALAIVKDLCATIEDLYRNFKRTIQRSDTGEVE